MALRLFQNNFTSGVLSPGMWSRTDLAKYRSGCQEIVNGVIHAHGGVSKRPGTRYVDQLPGAARLVDFSYSRSENYLLAFLDQQVRFYCNGAVLTKDGEAYAVESPYTLEEAWEFRFVQSADVLIIAHPSHPPRTLTRSGHTDWAFAEMEFEPLLPAPAVPMVERSGFEGDLNQTLYYRISCSGESGEESYPSEAAAIKVPKSWTAGARVLLSWSAVPGAQKYHVYKNKRGFYGWVGTVDASDGLSFSDDNIDPSAEDGPKEERNPFADGNYPGVVGIYQQRLVFARSDRQRQTVWCSQPGNFKNFACSYPLKDDDSIEATMDSRKMDEIRHLLLLKRALVVLTAGAEWTMSPGLNSDAITPSSTRFESQSFFGSSRVPPLTAGDSILILQGSGTVVRDLYYTVTEEYTGMELSILAEHLLERPVVDWTWQLNPYHAVYAVREDGVLLTLTYLREQEVYAWSEHRTEGAYRSVCCLRRDQVDELYFVVERDGAYFLEMQEPRAWGTAVADSFFVDCGLSYDDPDNPISHVTGLEHLAGRRVAVLADGNDLGLLEVNAAGCVRLPRPASVIHAGLPYQLKIVTLDPELNAPDGTTAGLRKCVVKAGLFLRECSVPRVGPDAERTVLLKPPAPENWGEAPLLVSGYREAVLPKQYRREGTVTILHDAPLPCTILSLVVHLNSES